MYSIPTSLNPSDKFSGITLSAGNLSLVNSGRGLARSYSKAGSGKWYVEFTRVGDTKWMGGLALAAESLANYPGATNNSIGLYEGSVYVNNAVVATVANLNNTGVFGMAIDMGARTVRFFDADATTAAITIPGSGDVFLACGNGNTPLPSGSMSLNAGQSAFAYSVPSGFTSGFALRDVYGINGTVLDAAGAPAARTVRAFLRSSGALMGEVVSNGTTGAYRLIPEPNSTAALTVEFLPNSTSENAIIFDRVVPA